MAFRSEHAARLAPALAGALVLAGCAADPPRPWVSDAGAGTTLEQALAECRAYVDEHFNPYEDFSDPVLGSTSAGRDLNARVALRRMFESCMAERGFRRG